MNKNLEIGKVVFVTYGPSAGKIGLILDILDEKRILLDGPCGRQIINIKRIVLTSIKKEVNGKITSQKAHKIMKYNNILKNWYKTKGKIQIKKTFIKNFTDFERFKYMIGKKHQSQLLHLNIMNS